ncbi:hypothetical protein THAOC_23521, partial [Thalassiosira oceanica]
MMTVASLKEPLSTDTLIQERPKMSSVTMATSIRVRLLVVYRLGLGQPAESPIGFNSVSKRRRTPLATRVRGAKGAKGGSQYHDMECSHGAAKRQRVQRVSTVESALASIDVLGHLAAFLEAGELCQVRATCKALGSRDGSAFDGLSMTEEAARRIYESASDEEKAMLPRHDDEGWIEL